MSKSHALYIGTTWHVRHLPVNYRFSYPYRLWGLNLDAPEPPPSSRWFSANGRLAVNQFVLSDHAALVALCGGDANKISCMQDISALIKTKLAQITGKLVDGYLMALVSTRTFGLYFSPVNFYIGHDAAGAPSHLLAEVSNTPWSETHVYGFLLTGNNTRYSHDKSFKVSPFNGAQGERYTWKVVIEKERLRLSIGLTDKRGRVFDAGVDLYIKALTQNTTRKATLTNPVINATSLARIYWHAFKLYALNNVPYVPYQKHQSSPTKSKQSINK